MDKEETKKSNFSKIWFLCGGSVPFIRSVKELREMVYSLSKSTYNQGFEDGLKYAEELKQEKTNG